MAMQYSTGLHPLDWSLGKRGSRRGNKQARECYRQEEFRKCEKDIRSPIHILQFLIICFICHTCPVWSVIYSLYFIVKLAITIYLHLFFLSTQFSWDGWEPSFRDQQPKPVHCLQGSVDTPLRLPHYISKSDPIWVIQIHFT